MEIYFHAKSEASRMKNEGVITDLVGGNKYDKREGVNRVKGKNHKVFHTGLKN